MNVHLYEVPSGALHRAAVLMEQVHKNYRNNCGYKTLPFTLNFRSQKSFRMHRFCTIIKCAKSFIAVYQV